MSCVRVHSASFDLSLFALPTQRNHTGQFVLVMSMIFLAATANIFCVKRCTTCTSSLNDGRHQRCLWNVLFLFGFESKCCGNMRYFAEGLNLWELGILRYFLLNDCVECLESMLTFQSYTPD